MHARYKLLFGSFSNYENVTIRRVTVERAKRAVICLRYFALLGTALTTFVPGVLAAAPANQANFSWQLTNRFRLLTAKDETRFASDLAKYKTNAHQGKFSVNPKYWQFAYARLTEQNYASNWDQPHAQYILGDYAWSKKRDASLTLKSPFGSKCTWTVNSAVISTQTCNGAQVTLNVGSNNISVSVNGRAVPLEPAIVEDYTAVVLGDSTASGEGNPQVSAVAKTFLPQGKVTINIPGKPALWLDQRCHRSVISGPLLALYEKSKGDRHRSVTIFDYACSGAEIDNGIMDGAGTKPYWGRETATQVDQFFANSSAPEKNVLRDQMLPDQVVQASEALCVATKSKEPCAPVKPDVVVIVTGANELKFSDVLEKLVEGCRDDACHKDMDGEMKGRVTKLNEQFSRLHDRVENWQPKQVLLVSYMNPVRDQNGAYCGDNYLNWLSPHFLPAPLGLIASAAGIRMNPVNSQFAEESLLTPLNNKLAEVANTYRKENWKVVTQQTRLSKNKGVCSKQRWVNTYGESAAKQGTINKEPSPDPSLQKTIGGVPSGAMHPNLFGHLAMANSLQAAFGK